MKKPDWDVEENIGFVKIEAFDGNVYKIVDSGTPQKILEVANTLASVRKDINCLLYYLCKNDHLWINHSMAFGMYHTFDIHMPCWKKLNTEFNFGYVTNKKINDKCSKIGKLFNYQEMTPNDIGLIGLNKPKKIITIQIENKNGKVGDYDIADRRSVFLTIRNLRTNRINDYQRILDLAIHEITHTTCNDIKWKENNHMPPYQSYHTLMRKWARECGILT